VESRFGREPSDIRWGPRVVDLDILLYGDEKVNEPDLEIPHPRLRERKFALIPMLEMEPGVTDPWEARYSDALDEAEGDVEFLEGF
jgi:2-amino-4-hydroxy-6-hydroxymethyldihydropteridine diphosphokinase